MPTLETVDGAPVEVIPVDPEAVNREFAAVMSSDGPDEQAPPRRQPKPAAEAEAPKPKRGRAPKDEKARTAPAASAPLDDGQRAQGVKGLAQVGAGIALLLGKATGKDAFKADAVTIASSADEIADAAIQVAHADLKFAAALDKVCSVGPYGAMITVAVGVGAQLARNHKPSLAIPGTVDPAGLLKAQDEAEEKADA
jgi:hypothetical protein